MRHLPALAFLLLSLGGCAPRPVLTPGTYLETRPNAVLFSSKELRLLPGGRLVYFQHEDDLSSGRQATGSYRLRGRTLELTFDGQPFAPSRARPRRLPASAVEPGLLFTVLAATDGGPAQPLPGANVLLRDAAGQPLGAFPCDQNGQTLLLPLRQSPRPASVEVFSIGFQPWKQAWPDTAGAYEVYLQPQFGGTYAAGTRKSFRVLAHEPGRLVLLQGQDTITLLAQPQGAGAQGRRQ